MLHIGDLAYYRFCLCLHTAHYILLFGQITTHIVCSFENSLGHTQGPLSCIMGNVGSSVLHKRLKNEDFLSADFFVTGLS